MVAGRSSGRDAGAQGARRPVPAGAVLPFDVVVVGAGVAGLVAALDLLDVDPSLSIAVVDKGTVGSSGSTPLAQGGMAAAVGPDDTPGLHAADTLRAGDGLGDPRAAAVLGAEGPARVADLVRRGVVFDRHPDGSFDLAREGGQRVARSVRAADATGAEIFRALRTAAAGRVVRLQGIACAIAQAGTDAAATGVWVLLDEVEASPTGPAQEGGLSLVVAPAVLLATGGCGGLYAATTNRDGATADGVSLAWAAGAALVDLEFVQFHPTGLKVHGGAFWRLLLTEALRGAGAVLRDADGRRFMVDRHPDAELAPRHVVTKAILDQPGGAWLDATALPAQVLAEEFPTVASGVRAHGYDLAAEPVPVEPAEHYMIGGVATDLDGRTSVPGLFAAGEAACTGVHGANRMAGNSLLQSCVFGHRAALAIARAVGRAADAPVRGEPDAPRLAPAPPPGADLGALRREVRLAMTAGAGAIRSAAGLEGAAKALDAVAAALGPIPSADRDGVELAHMVTAGRLIVRSATLRTESRGVHWRDDHPTSAAALAGVHLTVRRPPDG